MKKRTIYLILLMLVLIAMAALFRAHNQYLLLQGEVDAPEVIVSSKAKGRVVERLIERGDDVKQGQALIRLTSPELEAQVASLVAARDQAQAQLTESLNGTREESVRNYAAQLAKSQAELANAQRDFQRMSSMAGRGYVSKTELDQSRRARDVAQQGVLAAKAQLDQAKNGDRTEQRQRYEAALRQAEQKLAELKVQQDELTVTAPVTGEIGPVPAEIGELFNAGSPLVTIIRLPEAYFVYNLREDILADVKKGDKITLTVPALKNQEIEAEVRYIAPMGDYATKRATRATGDFDLKT
ncbi:efflux RND transporter periplasmic adaptor subunit, partial [Morganella morganii]